MNNYLLFGLCILLLDPDHLASVIGFSRIKLFNDEERFELADIPLQLVLMGMFLFISNPIILGDQAFSLNNIEIGQFIKIKYKVGKVNIIAVIVETLISLKFLEIIMPLTSRFTNITIPNEAGNLSVIGSPWEFRNILSSLYSTLLSLANLLGRKRIDSTIQIKLKVPDMFERSSLIETAKTIPTQNIRFQKLSLVKRFLAISTSILCIIIWKILTYFNARSKVLVRF